MQLPVRIERLPDHIAGGAHVVTGRSSRGVFALPTKVPAVAVKLSIGDAQVILTQAEAIEIAIAIGECTADG